MKNTFSGYYKEDDDIVNVLKTENAVIVLDSAILCNLFGFSDSVWKPVLELMSEKQKMFWLPYNIAYDYHRNILPTIIQKIQLLVSIKNRLRQAVDLLKAIPFEPAYIDTFSKTANTISTRLTREVAILRQKCKKDSDIREAIARIFEGRIGSSNNDPNQESFKVKLYLESDQVDAITGGDHLTPSSSRQESPIQDKNNIILHTLIKLSIDKNQDVIYVICEPSKYWSMCIGSTSFGPNPEHQTYFRQNTFGHNLYCCPFAAFINNLSNSLSKKLDSNVIKYLKHLSYGTSTQNYNNNDEEL